MELWIDGVRIQAEEGQTVLQAALAAARALAKNTDMSAREIAVEAMRIASEICVFTNGNLTVEEV